MSTIQTNLAKWYESAARFHVSTCAVTRRKSLKSTPCETNRGAQLSIAACTRSSGTCHHLLDRSSEVVQHHGRRVAPRPRRHGSARMRGRARLVQARDREPVLGPSRNRAKAARLRGTHLAAVTRAAPVVLVQRLQVD